METDVLVRNDKFEREILNVLDEQKKIFVMIIIFAIVIITLAQVTMDVFNIQNIFDKKKNVQLLDVSNPDSIFQIVADKDDLIVKPGVGIIYKEKIVNLKPEFEKEYDKVRYSEEQNAVVVYPTFTEASYKEEGFYDYFGDFCDESCLTVAIGYDFEGSYGASDTAYQILKLLDYPIITDVDVDKNPKILEKYDKIILLHNEYVTKEMFDAITSHPNVIYLYPNALYAEVIVDYELETISLVKGHGYPNGEDNGFGWEYDNTRPYEFDTECNNWEFYSIPNGKMLNCYPENFIKRSWDLLYAIKTM